MASKPHIDALKAEKLPATTKYWIGRLANAVDIAIQAFEIKRSDLVKKYGFAFKMVPQEPIDGVAQPPKRVEITSEEDMNQPHMMDVKPENMEKFQAEAKPLMETEFELKFNGKPFKKLPLWAFDDVPVSADLSALHWMIDEDAPRK